MVSSKWRFAPKLLFLGLWVPHITPLMSLLPAILLRPIDLYSLSPPFHSSPLQYCVIVLRIVFAHKCFCKCLFVVVWVKLKKIQHNYSRPSQKLSWVQLPKYNCGWFTRPLAEEVFSFFSWLLASSHAAVVAKGFLAISKLFPKLYINLTPSILYQFSFFCTLSRSAHAKDQGGKYDSWNTEDFDNSTNGIFRKVLKLFDVYRYVPLWEEHTWNLLKRFHDRIFWGDKNCAKKCVFCDIC